MKQKFKFILVSILAGITSGFILGYLLMKQVISEELFFYDPSIIFIYLLYLLLSAFLTTIIHEAGHLIFGLLTGYEFISFRVMNLMLVKQDNRLKLKKLKIAGTDGQCLLCPPEPVNDRIPFFWYNLGGVLLNLICAIISLAIIKNRFFVIFGTINLLVGLMNGIPLGGLVDNDGKNLLNLCKNPELCIPFYQQLKINALYLKGTRLKDMPGELFESKFTDENTISKAIEVFQCNRLMDQHNFPEAYQRMNALLDNNLIGLYHNLLLVDILYCQLINDETFEEAKYLDKQFKGFMKSMANYPSIMRLQYTYNLLYLKDEKKANEYRNSLISLKESYPYPCEIESELELIQISKNKGDE